MDFFDIGEVESVAGSASSAGGTESRRKELLVGKQHSFYGGNDIYWGKNDSVFIVSQPFLEKLKSNIEWHAVISAFDVTQNGISLSFETHNRIALLLVYSDLQNFSIIVMPSSLKPILKECETLCGKLSGEPVSETTVHSDSFVSIASERVDRIDRNIHLLDFCQASETALGVQTSTTSDSYTMPGRPGPVDEQGRPVIIPQVTSHPPLMTPQSAISTMATLRQFRRQQHRVDFANKTTPMEKVNTLSLGKRMTSNLPEKVRLPIWDVLTRQYGSEVAAERMIFSVTDKDSQKQIQMLIKRLKTIAPIHENLDFEDTMSLVDATIGLTFTGSEGHLMNEVKMVAVEKLSEMLVADEDYMKAQFGTKELLQNATVLSEKMTGILNKIHARLSTEGGNMTAVEVKQRITELLEEELYDHKVKLRPTINEEELEAEMMEIAHKFGLGHEIEPEDEDLDEDLP